MPLLAVLLYNVTSIEQWCYLVLASAQNPSMGPKQRYHHLVLHTFQVKTTSPARLLLCSVILVVQLKLSSYTSNHANHSNHTIHTTNQSLVEDVVLLTTIPVTGQVSRLFQPSEHLASTGAQNNSRAGTGVCSVHLLQSTNHSQW